MHLYFSTASLSGSTVSNCTATSSTNDAFGGAMLLYSSTASLSGSTVSDCTATSSDGSAYGGAMYLYSSTASLSGSIVSGCTATSLDGNVRGGAMHLDSASTTSLSGSTISDCTATSLGGNASGGAMHLYGKSRALVDATTLSRCTVTSRVGRAQGGGVSVLGRDTNATFVSSVIEHCTASSTNGTGEGGGLFAEDAFVRMTQHTELRLNVASALGASALQLLGGLLLAEYILPGPPGSWLAAQTCSVFRDACPENWLKPQCEKILPTCAGIPDSTNASVGGVPCPKASVVQPCRWCARVWAPHIRPLSAHFRTGLGPAREVLATS